MFLSIGLSTALLPGKSRIDCPLYQDNKVTTGSATARRCGRLGRLVSSGRGPSSFFAHSSPPINASFWVERNAPPLSQVKQLWHIVLIGVHLSIKAKFVLAASPGQKLKFTMEEFNRACNTLLKHRWPSLAP
jgi:hypothetical protein